MIPGFEDGIIGMSAGENTSLDLKFPKDYHAEDLKGAKVKFKVEVNDVSSKKLPKLDNDFFKLNIDIDVKDKRHLTKVIGSLRTSEFIDNVNRV